MPTVTSGNKPSYVVFRAPLHQTNGITGRIRLDAAPVARKPVETEEQRLGREAMSRAGDYAKAQASTSTLWLMTRLMMNYAWPRQVKLLQRVEGADLGSCSSRLKPA